MDTVEKPEPKVNPPAPNPLALFLIKTAIVCAATIIAGTVILDNLTEMVDNRIQQLRAEIRASAQVSGLRTLARMETVLDGLADPSNDLSPERKEKLLSDIRILADRWRPFLAAAMRVLPDDPDKAAATPRK